ncbi:MAG TPA: hypothetical protein VIS07_15780 [Candidatus Binatia bacterium]
MNAARKIVYVAGGLLFWATVAATSHAQERVPVVHPCDTPDPERPYVCDIGPPRPLSMRSFREVLANDQAIRALVKRIGMPYAVEVQRVRVEDPWYSWEVRAYYPEYNRMFAFGRAFILGVPEVSLLRYEGPIPPDRRWPAVTRIGGDAEDAAARAERAAAEAEALADQAERFADRAEAIADQGARDFTRSLYKN